MRRRKLGRTGFEVAEVGFGGWGVAGHMWRGVGDDEALAALRGALELGIDFFDTALVYGDGHGERLLGRAIADQKARDRVVVATKLTPGDRSWPGRADRRLRETFPPQHLVDSVDRSLRNLRIDVIHLAQLHCWHDAWLAHPEWDDTRWAMEKLARQGKVMHWGVSANDGDPDSAIEALAQPIFATVMATYNVFDRSAERALLARARERELGVIVKSPFDEGALTGAVRADTEFPPGDWRERYFRGERRREAAQRVEALERLLGDEAPSLPELALRFCLARPEVSVVIPGMRRLAHVVANAGVSDGRALSPALLERLGAHAWEKNWYP